MICNEYLSDFESLKKMIQSILILVNNMNSGGDTYKHSGSRVIKCSS